MSKCPIRPKSLDLLYVQPYKRPSVTIHGQLSILHMTSQFSQICTSSINYSWPTFSTPKCMSLCPHNNELSEFSLKKYTHFVTNVGGSYFATIRTRAPRGTTGAMRQPSTCYNRQQATTVIQVQGNRTYTSAKCIDWVQVSQSCESAIKLYMIYSLSAKRHSQ